MHDIQNEKSNRQQKSFHIGNLKKKKKFIVYLAISKLRRNF